jgi:hypothetical protein
MKTYINKLKFLVLTITLLVVASCAQDDTLVKKVQDNVTNGAELRTIKINQGTFNFFDVTQKWSITVEEQDNSKGTLMSEVKLYATQKTGGVTKSEKLVKTFPASIFETGPDGYPRATLDASLQETLTALGITIADCLTDDNFSMRLELILKDGRTFSSTNISSSLGNAYFSSPFKYSVQFFCPLADASTFDGNYAVVSDNNWQDYSPGDIIPLVYSAANGTFKFRVLCSNNAYLNNPTTSYIEVTIDPLTGSVTAKSNEDFDYGGASKFAVTGTGTVGTCTGDVTLLLNFGTAYKNQKLVLKKAN